MLEGCPARDVVGTKYAVGGVYATVAMRGGVFLVSNFSAHAVASRTRQKKSHKTFDTSDSQV